MKQDPTNRYIAAIISQCNLGGRDVLEIGCGKGRITRDLITHARRVVATDPDSEAIEKARVSVDANNVDFIATSSGIPDLPDGSFDVVIYTLSLHHVPIAEMVCSLGKAAAMLKKDGVIMVLEPGETGSFTLVKERYGAGSGNERLAKDAAIRSMRALNGWSMEETILFYAQFQFDNDEDFFDNMMPGYRQLPEKIVSEVRTYLDLRRTEHGIILDAERRLNVLRRVIN